VLYLTGARPPKGLHHLAAGTIGLLNTPVTSYRLDGVKVWAADNGAFTGKYPGDDAYLRWLARQEPHRDRCLFVAAPDVIGDGAATLERFTGMGRRIRDAGWPVALVAQDGMEPGQVPWDQLDWLFVGGSTEWKLGFAAARLIETAQAHGVRVHVGRVNTFRRYRLFAALGCDSADGTFLAYGYDANMPQILDWYKKAGEQALF